ncbi:MAG: PDDEXK nuclease domain-containing protein [Acidobacteriia bacterium]|nr:PDDEXK nuclease domain-containing protein [Terriglobia bacterium]
MKRNHPELPDRYHTFLQELKERIRSAQVRAALSVNRELVLLYWGIGKDILTRQQSEGWGAKVVDRLALDLLKAFPGMSGFGARNLKYMRAFAGAYPDQQFVQQVVAQLPWGHNVRILEMVKAPAQREWYIRQAVESGWTRNVLVHQIESQLHRRQGRAITNFQRTLPAPQSELAQNLLKDPYNFDFLTLGPEMLERDLERGLIDHLRKLILELGKGFAFVGNQYYLKIGGQDYFIDLLFYHLRLRCYVVIDLKIEEFRPEFAGKMNFYLSAVDDILRHADDAPSIGLILCKAKNKIVVEYALRDTGKPVGVAQYRLIESLPKRLQSELPTNDDLAGELPLFNLVTLRFRLERALQEIAEKWGLSARLAGIGALAGALIKTNALSAEVAADLRAVSAVLNSAVHGQKIKAREARAALQLGNSLLSRLEGND